MEKQRFYFKSSPNTGFYWDGLLLEQFQSQYQKIGVIYNEEMGNTLILDDYIMVAQADEHQYHELIVHPNCLQLSNHNRALIIGGGDGLCAEEVLKYNFNKVDMVEIDEAVSQVSQKYFAQQLGDTFSNPYLQTHYEDALGFLNNLNTNEKYDFIALDLNDPAEDFMHSHPLYSGSFYDLCKKHLQPTGIMVAQIGCPYLFQEHFLRNYKMLKTMFKHTMVYGMYMRCYGTYQYFVSCSDYIDFHHPNYVNMRKQLSHINSTPLKLYNINMHESMFFLNTEIKNILLK